MSATNAIHHARTCLPASQSVRKIAEKKHRKKFVRPALFVICIYVNFSGSIPFYVRMCVCVRPFTPCFAPVYVVVVAVDDEDELKSNWNVVGTHVCMLVTAGGRQRSSSNKKHCQSLTLTRAVAPVSMQQEITLMHHTQCVCVQWYPWCDVIHAPCTHRVTPNAIDTRLSDSECAFTGAHRLSGDTTAAADTNSACMCHVKAFQFISRCVYFC